MVSEDNPYSSTSVPTDETPTDDVTDVGLESNNGAPAIQARKVPAKTDQGKILSIAVSDPVKQGEGLKAHISYKINTKTDLPEFDMSQFSVIRRYSDFVWLISQLSSSTPVLPNTVTPVPQLPVRLIPRSVILPVSMT